MAEPATLLQYTEQNLATPLAAFDKPILETSSFFVRSHFGPPALSLDRPLRIAGLVKNALTFAPSELRRFEQVTLTAMLLCAENGRALYSPPVPGIQFGLGAMGQATFSGVRLRDLLKEAGLDAGAAHVAFAAADRPHKPYVPPFVRSIPLARALDPTTLVATHLNGEPLTLEHGAPLRLVVPGWAGQHWIKWLKEIRVQKEEADGYFMQNAYRSADGKSALTSFPVGSVLANPLAGAKLKPGPVEIRGVAFSGEAALKFVEVSLDEGLTFTKAKLEGESEKGRWQVFRHLSRALKPGSYRVQVRATDKNGNTQPQTPPHHPGGYFWNGWHTVQFEVEP